MKKLFVCTALLGAVTLSHAGAIGWNFTDLDGTYDTGTPSHFSVGTMGIGNSLGVVANAFSATSASSGYAGATGTGNIGNATLIGGLNVATSSYFSFSLTAAQGYTFTLSDFDFGARSTSTGAQAFDLRVGSNFTTSLMTASVANDAAWHLINSPFTAYTSGVGQTVEFRLYAYGGAGAASNNTVTTRLDDISMVVNATAAVPEPSTLALAAIALLGVVQLRRRSV